MFSNKSKHQMKNQTKQLHKELDKFIQNCLSKFRFVEPPKDFYNIVDDERKSIISYKSTIPDLVIWNQTFNKNECFIDSNLSKINPFPRFKFFLRFAQCKNKKKRKNRKNKNKNKKEKSSSHKSNMKNNSENVVEINENILFDESKSSENVINCIEKIDLKDKNEEQNQGHDDDSIQNEKKEEKLNVSSHTNKNKINLPNSPNVIEVNNNKLESNDLKINIENNDNNNKFNNQISFNYVDSLKTNNQSQNILNNYKLTQNSSLSNKNYPNRISSYNNNYIKNNQNIKNKNKFSMPSFSIIKNKKSINDYYQNQFKQNELLMNLVYSFLETKGWIIFKNNGNYISNFTSFELFTFLTNILKNNGDLKLFMIRIPNSLMTFNGEQIYIILSQTLPIIFQKKQYELMKNENMKRENIKEKENNKINNENISDKDSHDSINYNLELYGNNYEEDDRDDYGNNDDDNNCFNFNNNFFSNQPQGNTYDNFDSSIFNQSK